MSRLLSLALLAGIPTVALVGCSSEPKTSTQRQDLNADARAVLARAEARDSTLRPMLDAAPGYAVFPKTGEAGAIVGAGYGKGVLFERGVIVGYCDLTQTSIGAELGSEQFAEIIVFKTHFALQDFKNGDTNFGTLASTVAIKEGSAASTSFDKDIAVFSMAEKGLEIQASLSGQTFRYTPIESMEAKPAGAKMGPESSEDETDVRDLGSGTRVTTPGEE